ncbi:MAG: hypothetical protein WCP32_13470 [Bacteroidota bacterium]
MIYLTPCHENKNHIPYQLIGHHEYSFTVKHPGDLSLNGEQVSHVSVAGFLKELTSAGIKVKAINGNHDMGAGAPG